MNSFITKVVRKIKRSNFLLNLFGLFGRELKPDKWVFILGCYNSGTTLLSKVLSYHHQISGLPDEGIAYTNRIAYPELFGWPRMWIKCRERMNQANSLLSAKDARQIKKQWSFWYLQRPVLVEKSISDVTRIDFLKENFTPAYFIILRRNGFAVAEGIQRKANLKKWGNKKYKEKYPIGLCAEQWVKTYHLLEIKKESLSNYIEISYEDFTEKTESTLHAITSFLGLEPFPQSTFQHNWKLQGRNKPIINMNKKSFDRLSEEDIKKIESVAGTQLQIYGYSVG